MPFLLSVLASIAVMAGVITAIAELGTGIYEAYQARQEKVRLDDLKSALEEFYRDNAMAVNSFLRPDETISTRNGNQPSGQIVLPDGEVLRSYLGRKPVSVASTSEKALLYFVGDENALLDRKGVPFRIYITPVQLDPEGRFQYRDIYIISGKGRTAPVASYPVCELTPSGYYSCKFFCSPDEICEKVDGYKITLSLYQQTFKQLEDMAKRIQTYAQQLYAQDPQKDVLRYYLSHESTNNKNDLNCTAGSVDCYFSHLSEIRNSTLYNQLQDTRARFNNYVVPFTVPSGSRLAYASSIPFLPNTKTPFHAEVFYDNSSGLIRNPQTVSNYAGYTMMLYTPVDDYHGIEYYFGQ